MKKYLFSVLVVWLMMVGVGTACAIEDPSCSQNQSINNKTDIKNLNTNIVAPVQHSVSGAISGSTSSATTGPSTSSATSSATGGNATGGNATAYGGAGGQGGSATASANPTSNANNNMTVLYPEEKRELPNIPSAPGVSQLEYRGPYGKGIYQFILPWRVISEWTPDKIKDFPSCIWNCKTETAILFKADATNKFTVVNKSSLRYMGFHIIRATNPLELWGKVSQIAFEVGASEVKENAFQSLLPNKSSGWTVGVLGGMTAINGGNDTFGGAIGGGTGFGSVETGSIEKCEGAFTFYAK